MIIQQHDLLLHVEPENTHTHTHGVYHFVVVCCSSETILRVGEGCSRTRTRPLPGDCSDWCEHQSTRRFCSTLSCLSRNTPASSTKPPLPHTLSKLHLPALVSTHPPSLPHPLRPGLGEGLSSSSLLSTAVTRGLLQMIPLW